MLERVFFFKKNSYFSWKLGLQPQRAHEGTGAEPDALGQSLPELSSPGALLPSLAEAPGMLAVWDAVLR